MNHTALVVIDIQNDITKHYRDIIDNINSAIDWAMGQAMTVIYIKHNNLSAGTRTFKPGTKGETIWSVSTVLLRICKTEEGRTSWASSIQESTTFMGIT
ncbi:MAG: isochorismatase family protein, partial [Lachnospiraceae bacterium]|nr:isochorismatase family protein [Lachnospiraceae bacterium]